MLMAKDDELAYPTDYDREPERFRAGVTTAERYSLAGDVHERVAARLSTERLGPVLDLGSGEGRLIAPLRSRSVPVVGFDNSPTMLASLRGPRVRGTRSLSPSAPTPSGRGGALRALPLRGAQEDHRGVPPRAATGRAVRSVRPQPLRPSGAGLAPARRRPHDL